MIYAIEKSFSCDKLCDAPLCPLDGDIKWRGWFPDEPICAAKGFSGLDWIRNQRKVRKRAGDQRRYFTHEMLGQECRIKTGIKGLNPDLPSDTEEQRVRRWLAKHPPKRHLSSEERREFIERMRRSRVRQNSYSAQEEACNRGS